jgi:hypothetical protein
VDSGDQGVQFHALDVGVDYQAVLAVGRRARATVEVIDARRTLVAAAVALSTASPRP